MNVAAFRARVGRLIRTARDAAGLRQDDVATRVGPTVTKSLLSRYECGAVLPRIERLKVILEVCGVHSIPPLIEVGYRETANSQPTAFAQVIATEVAKEFVEVWVRCRSIDGVAEAMGMTRVQVKLYVQRLRLKGLHLPRARPRKRPKEDIAKLQEFLESIKSAEQPNGQSDHD